jgi:hypothetical protein
MIRENWRSPGFWRWWWQNAAPIDVKAVIVLVLVGLLLVGGFFASGHLTSAKAADSSGSKSYVLETTVRKVVTVREHGKVVVKRVPIVVRRTVVQASTDFQTVVDTQVVTTPGGVRYVEKKVVRYVPVVHTSIVHVNGTTKTLTQTRLVPTTRTETQTLTNVVTNEQTVTNQNTVVVAKTQTVVQPVTTVETKTVTAPPQTVTETQTETQTHTETVFQTVTETEPGVTITITVPSL